MAKINEEKEFIMLTLTNSFASLTLNRRAFKAVSLGSGSGSKVRRVVKIPIIPSRCFF
jgi:hypothetical protein